MFPRPAFESIQAFLFMDGHGAYVWSAFCVVAVFLCVLAWLPRYLVRKFQRQMTRDGGDT